ncbi:MAG: leucine-rich repeat protein, partial [Lachnospiraceae bacterium]|nr:leucine-rich repeat protein [Lachnospiraceae bacterium]
SKGDSGAFNFARVTNLVFSDGCPLEVIPEGFFEVTGEGNPGHPGRHIEYAESGYVYTFVDDPAQIRANSLETVSFGENNHIKLIENGAFKNQSHMKKIDFGTPSVDLIIDYGAFAGVGNNGYLYENKKDSELNAGVVNLTFPAKLTELREGAFEYAKIVNLSFSDDCQLSKIPNGFLSITGAGTYGYPGMLKTGDRESFVYDQAQIEANSLETINFGTNNHLTSIENGSFFNQNHLKSVDFGTSKAEEFSIGGGAFSGAGNNGYLVEREVDEEYNEGIETLVFPANLKKLDALFEYAKIKNVVFSDNCKLESIPTSFMGVIGAGCNGYPGMLKSMDKKSFVDDKAQIEANSLETISFGANNNLSSIGSGAFYNQSHLTSIDFGTSDKNLSIIGGAFIGAGNNGYLVDNGIDETLNEGIETLTFPANLNSLSSAFEYACVKNLVFSDNCRLKTIPQNFLGITGEGCNGQPGKQIDYSTDPDTEFFEKDQAQLAANSLETINFGQNNQLSSIDGSAFRNQSHVTEIDFGTSTAGSLSISSGAFIGAGNNTYLVEQGADDSLSEGIELTLPANLSKPGDGAFEYAGIKSIKFSEGSKITSLNSGSFQDLDLMEKLILGEDCKLTKLDGGAFSTCDELTLIDLEDSSIANIDDAIKLDPKLTGIIFPEKLESITWKDTSTDREKKCPFYGCDNVNKLQFTNPDPSGVSFDKGVFQHISESGTVYVPEETTDAQIADYKAKLIAAGLDVDEADHWKIKRGHVHVMEKTEGVPATCTSKGNEEYWTCNRCDPVKYFSDEKGENEIEKNSWVTDALGHDWGEWTVTKPATVEEEGEETRVCGRCEEKETRTTPKLTPTPTPTPTGAPAPGGDGEETTPTPTPAAEPTPTEKPVPTATPTVEPIPTSKPAPTAEPEEEDKIVYTVVSGGDSTFTIGSTDPVVITVKRSVDDDTCFSHFTSVQIDGAALTATQDYDTKAGSTIVTIYASKLEKLSNGKHTVSVIFDDGKAETSVTISGKGNGGSEGDHGSRGGNGWPDGHGGWNGGPNGNRNGGNPDINKKDPSKQTVKPTAVTSAPAAPKGKGAAATADNSMPLLWASLAGAGLLGFVIAVRRRKRA